MESRTQKESAIKAFANSVSFVDINPSIHTHLGKVTMLDKNSALIEEIGTDWCTIGHLQDLTDEELNQFFHCCPSLCQQTYDIFRILLI